MIFSPSWSRGVAWLTCDPVKVEIAGSNPVGSAILNLALHERTGVQFTHARHRGGLIYIFSRSGSVRRLDLGTQLAKRKEALT